jgi:hypothetical protein
VEHAGRHAADEGRDQRRIGELDQGEPARPLEPQDASDPCPQMLSVHAL